MIKNGQPVARTWGKKIGESDSKEGKFRKSGVTITEKKDRRKGSQKQKDSERGTTGREKVFQNKL